MKKKLFESLGGNQFKIASPQPMGMMDEVSSEPATVSLIREISKLSGDIAKLQELLEARQHTAPLADNFIQYYIGEITKIDKLILKAINDVDDQKSTNDDSLPPV
jgi:hypothetical protein